MEWVVVLEADRGADVGDVSVSDLARLVDFLTEWRPVGLYGSERYMLQLVVEADTPADALHRAIAHWDAGIRELGLPSWTLVRSETLTPDEFELERRLVGRDGEEVPGDTT
jgi:hypothetical protein